MLGFYISRSQCIFIYVNEKVKGVEIPIVNEEFQIIVNDSIKHTRRSKSDGSLGRIVLEKGTYKVKIVNPDFSEGNKADVIVNESRTTDVEMLLTRKPKDK
jgi:LytS/YehU family sensor histidine kinase